MQNEEWEGLIHYVETNHLNKPEDYVTMEKLRQSLKVDRRVSLREILEMIFGRIPYLKTRQELLEEEFDRFDSRYMPQESLFTDAKTVFTAYLTDTEYRNLVDSRQYARLNVHPNGTAWFRLTDELRKLIPDYIKDNVSFNKFAI